MGTHCDQLILLADDEEMLRNLIRSILSKAGYQVLTAADGKAAVEVALNEPRVIDLLLTDVEMPEMDGLTAYPQIKKVRPDIKVLFMSGGGLLSQLNLPQSLPFLQKPFGQEALRAKLEQIFEDKQPVGVEWLKVILVVDQNVQRRERTKRILNESGYAVLTTYSVEEAEAVSDSIATIDLIISEVMFAGSSGVHLAEHVEASRRDISTLLISHFSKDILKGVSGFSRQPEFLPNFFTKEALLDRVQKLLADRPG